MRNYYSQFDDHGDPLEHGAIGWAAESDGIRYMPGCAVGIVLSVGHADSEDNLMYRLLAGDDPTTQSSEVQGAHLQAKVLLINNGGQCSIELAHCVILPFGKSSAVGPSANEPADFSEDVPNGCTPEELELFSRGEAKVSSLSGDWVLLNFIGGQLEQAVISGWFPNPRNKTDAAKKEDGRRFRLRRSNSELQIDKNGDLHLTHRVGQYLMMKGEAITLKHRHGQTIHLDDEGALMMLDGYGNQLLMDDDGLSYNNGTALFNVHNKGVRVTSPQGDMNCIVSNFNVLASSITLSASLGAKALLHEDLLPQITNMVAAMTAINTNLIALTAALDALAAGVVGTGPAFKTAIVPIQSALAANSSSLSTITGLLASDATTAIYRTKVLSAE